MNQPEQSAPDALTPSETYGRLTVIDKPLGRFWLCQCSCGSPVRMVARYRLRKGHSTSCGCKRSESSARDVLTADVLRSILHYDPNTGVFTWRNPEPKSNAKPGDIAGFLNSQGYHKVCVRKRFYSAHRLAWLYVYGEWPSQQIDHINRQRSDNRLVNLRDVDHSTNVRNSLRYENAARRKGEMTWIR